MHRNKNYCDNPTMVERIHKRLLPVFPVYVELAKSQWPEPDERLGYKNRLPRRNLFKVLSGKLL